MTLYATLRDIYFLRSKHGEKIETGHNKALKLVALID